jgi:branched-chain amino acid transport system permease protein
MLFEQLIVIGLITGAVYSLVGVGFTLVLGVGKIANFAHGSFVAVGLYFALTLKDHLGANPYVALVPGLVFFTIVALGVAELFERRGRKVGEIGELLIGLALLLLVGGLLETVYGDKPRTLEGLTAGSVHIFGLVLSGTEIIAAVFTFVLAAATYVFVRRTRWGRAMQAVAEDPEAAGLYGVHVPVAQRAAVVISIVIAGIAGILISPFTVITPGIGTNYLISAFAVVIIGGIGNTLGAVGAGLAIGVIESLSSGYLASYWTTLAPLLVILIVLLVQPERELAK